MGGDEIRSELVEVLGQLKAHLEYLEGLGVSQVEEVPVPAMDQNTTAEVAESAETLMPDNLQVVADQTSDARSRRQTRSVSDVFKGEDMPPKKAPSKPIGQQSLFGELAAAEPEPEPPQDQTLDEIRADVGECTRCKLCQARTTIVFGEGNPRARIMFVGEGPGADEDAQGRPFVGRAGQLLTRMIEAIGLRREDVYITNVVMCRPPGNRTPEPDEIAACEPFLLRRIKVIKPDIIVSLGAVATQTLLRSKASISQVRGRFFDSLGTKILPTFHPAFLLRSPDKKREAWEDLKKVRDFIESQARS